MTREQALALLALPREPAVERIRELARKAELRDKAQAGDKDAGDGPSPTTPSGMTAPYQKPAHRKKTKKPGQKKGHLGQRRSRSDHIDASHVHSLDQCPDCGRGPGKPCRKPTRLIEDIPPVEPEVRQHQVQGYWCGHCRKIVTPAVTDALPRASLGLNVLVYSAWLHYLRGVSVGNIARLLSVRHAFSVSAGGLTRARARLATRLEPEYRQIEQQVRESGALPADETGWRVNGLTHWLWAFCTQRLCYYLIDRRRSSAVVAKVLGEVFDGILITDFYGAYNLVNARAKQRPD